MITQQKKRSTMELLDFVIWLNFCRFHGNIPLKDLHPELIKKHFLHSFFIQVQHKFTKFYLHKHVKRKNWHSTKIDPRLHRTWVAFKVTCILQYQNYNNKKLGKKKKKFKSLTRDEIERLCLVHFVYGHDIQSITLNILGLIFLIFSPN